MQEPNTGIRGMADETLRNELLREAARLTHNPADAQDLLQDTLERGLRKFDLYTHGSLRAWLFHIMRNLFIDRCRKQRPTNDSVELLSIPAVNTTLPSWALVSDEALSAAIAALDPGAQEIFLLKEREQRSYLEIAERLGIPVATVGTRLLRARRKLRALLVQQVSDIAEGTGEGNDVQMQ